MCLCPICVRYTSTVQHVSGRTFRSCHSTWMGNLARDVLFRMPARDVIHYSRSPALTNLMHGQVPATIPKLL